MRVDGSHTAARARTHGGFTLIELLVVIAIISLLVSILLPSLNRAKMMAKEVVCLSNMKQIGLSIAFYADANNNYLPYCKGGYLKPLPGQAESFYHWFTLLSEFAGKKIEPGSYDMPSIFYSCPEFKWDAGSKWDPGYGMIIPLYDSTEPLPVWFRSNCYKEGEPLFWGPVVCEMSKRSEFTSPEKQGWMNDCPGHMAGGDPKQTAYVPELEQFPGWQTGAGSLGKDPVRHGGRSNILFVDGHVQSLGDKISGWTFSNVNKVD